MSGAAGPLAAGQLALRPAASSQLPSVTQHSWVEQLQLPGHNTRTATLGRIRRHGSGQWEVCTKIRILVFKLCLLYIYYCVNQMHDIAVQYSLDGMCDLNFL